MAELQELMEAYVAAAVPEAGSFKKPAVNVYHTTSLDLKWALYVKLMKHTQYNKLRTANILGVNRNTLYSWEKAFAANGLNLTEQGCE